MYRRGLIHLPYCPRFNAVVVASLFSAGAFANILTTRYAEQVHSTQSRQSGRYTAPEAIETAKPIIESILPGCDGLYVTAEPGEMTLANGHLQRVWNVNYIDSNGDYLVHIVRNAFTGAICWMGYDVIGRPASAHPIHLSRQDASTEGQRWMRVLGFTEAWRLSNAERHRVWGSGSRSYAWALTLQTPGWRARLTINERVGALVYANIVPTR